MRNSKKVLASVMSMVLCFSAIGSMSASATTKSVSETGNVFVNAWEKTKSYESGDVKLTYGYDTWCQNEDYCKSYVKSTSHSAKVQAGSLSETKSGKKGKWSGKADVKHASGTVTWKVMW